MSGTDIIILSIILLLAIPFGYFLRKALFQNENESLQIDLLKARELTSAQKIELVKLRSENTELSAKLESLQNEFYSLTLAYKDQQQAIIRKEEEIHRKEYEVPPQLPHLEESIELLSQEITRLRDKIKKWRNRDYVKANKKLKKKLVEAALRYKTLEQKSQDLDKYNALHDKIRELNNEANNIFTKKEKPVFEKKENPFVNQPEIRKKMIFKEIINSDKEDHKPSLAFDLESKPKITITKPVEKGLIDLIGIDNKMLETLANAGIHTFDDMIHTKIKKLGKILKKRGFTSKEYEFHTWPIQASLAKRGEWDVIEDYRKKL